MRHVSSKLPSLLSGSNGQSSRVINLNSVTIVWLRWFDDCFDFYEPFLNRISSPVPPKNPGFFPAGKVDALEGPVECGEQCDSDHFGRTRKTRLPPPPSGGGHLLTTGAAVQPQDFLPPGQRPTSYPWRKS